MKKNLYLITPCSRITNIYKIEKSIKLQKSRDEFIALKDDRDSQHTVLEKNDDEKLKQNGF